MATYGLYDDEDIDAKEKELEDEGKITYAACIAYVTEDYETYHEEMRKAAEDVLMGLEPEFLDEEEINRLTELYATDPVTDDDDQSDYDYQPIYTPPPSHNEPELTVGSYFGCCFTLVKWVFIIVSGLIVPYLCYRFIKLVIKELIKSRTGS